MLSYERVPLEAGCSRSPGKQVVLQANRRPNMAAYLIANVKVTDDAWLLDYAAKVHDIVHKHGGKYLISQWQYHDR